MKVLCIEWLFQNNKQIGYVCRNYILAKKFYKELIQYIPQNQIKSSNGTDLTITTIYGSTLTFYSAESGNSLRGLTFNYLICDEFAFFKQEQTDGTNLYNDILFPTIKVKGEKVIFVSTPLGKQNLFYEMYLKGLSEQYPQYHSILKTIYDDGLVSEEEIEDIKKQIPELSFRQEFLCEFLTNSLSVFPDYDNCFVDNFEYKNTKCYCGVDLSSAGSDETVVTFINSFNQVIQYPINGELDVKYKRIAELINEYNPVGTYIECNGVGSPMFNEIKKQIIKKVNVLPFTTTNNSKKEQVGFLSVAIQNNEIIFDKNNINLFGELGTFTFKLTKNGNITFAAQGGFHDDYVLSLMLSLQAKEDFKFNNNLTFVKKPIPFKIQ